LAHRVSKGCRKGVDRVVWSAGADLSLASICVSNRLVVSGAQHLGRVDKVVFERCVLRLVLHVEGLVGRMGSYLLRVEWLLLHVGLELGLPISGRLREVALLRSSGDGVLQLKTTLRLTVSLPHFLPSHTHVLSCLLESLPDRALFLIRYPLDLSPSANPLACRLGQHVLRRAS
jgi:hypothetical protein